MIKSSELQRIPLRGWRSGFTNLLRKENHAWWGTRRWWIQPLLWTVVIDGLLALVLFALPIAVEMDPAQNVADKDFILMGLQAVFQLGPLFLAAGVIVLAQDLLLGERQSGVAEWILTKPVSRTAYILSKFIVSFGGILVTMIIIPCAIAYGLFSWANQGSLILLSSYLVSVLGLLLHTLFYLALTLMLSTFVDQRGQLLGGAMGTLFGGLVLPGFLGKLSLVTPWVFPGVLPAFAAGESLPFSLTLPLVMTAIWCTLFVSIALWQFNRAEY